MKYSDFEKTLNQLDNELEVHYKSFETENRRWIKDGLVNKKKYFESKCKILWILKEPRDGKNNTGGGWSIVDNIRKERAKGLKKDSQATFHPITYATYAILNNIDDFNEMSKNKLYSIYSDILNKIGYINIQKLPASSKSNDKEILDAFITHELILINQIKVLNPDIIIFTAGSKLFNKIKHRFQDDNELKNKTLINTYHPAQTKIKRAEYINNIITKVKTS